MKKTEPLAIIGQGDNRVEIHPEHLPRHCSTPWVVLFVLWLFYAVIAWLVSLAKH